jgi:pimeloyl-ACP methyl ester carboxylesterase
MTTLYLHGFASSPQSGKITLLRQRGVELTTPDLNVPSFERLDFYAIVESVVAAARAQRPDALVGSSLGGLIALEAARRGVDAPLVLIAPALGVSDHWLSRIPDGDPISVFNYARNANAPIHRAFFEQMSRVDADRDAPTQRVTVIAGTEDESVGFAPIERTWRAWEASGKLAPGSRFIAIEGGDHGLTAHVDTIADAIRDAAADHVSASR